MLCLSTTRRFALNFALACAVGASASAQGGPQSNLPAMPPTSTAQAGNTAATPAKPDPNRAHKADVRYDSGLISITASNSSLNQILREISRQTGMKISGGVRDERVFGHYGPAPVGDILATLIGGTGTNMVLRQNAANAPEELILTPRGGGPSPPNPNAPGFDDSSDDDTQPSTATRPLGVRLPPPAPAPTPAPALTPNAGSVPPSVPPPANDVNGSPNNTSPTASTFPVTNSVPTDTIPTPSTTPPATGIVDAPNPPPPGVMSPTSPSGVKTPEDIYKQLQQLRAQQQQQQQQQQQSTTPPK
jgi:hypothetical protein